MSKICDCVGREVLDSRGNPTVEAEVRLEDGSIGRGMVPSGASTGIFEALELRDGEKERYQGKGVGRAVDNINTAIRAVLVGQEVDQIPRLDRLMRQADGTKDKSHLGANAILAVSMACARAAASSRKESLYRFFGGMQANTLPIPMMNILNGGVHARNTIDFQEFMIMPVGASSFREGLRMGTEVYHSLKSVLEEEKKNTAVGDEGGFAPALRDSFEVLEYLMKAVRRAGYEPGVDIVFAMDAAASELYQEDAGMYYFPGESQMLNDQDPRTPDTEKMGGMRCTDEMIELYEKICDRYPMVSIEDPLQEDDWDGWKKITDRLGGRIQLVGDDLFVTNTERLAKGIQAGCANAILIKVNQIGSLSETFEAVQMAHQAGYRTILSHRSGETEDTTIADLSVALNAGQIKTGAPCRSERTAKYNQLLRIEEELGEQARYGW